MLAYIYIYNYDDVLSFSEQRAFIMISVLFKIIANELFASDSLSDRRKSLEPQFSPSLHRCFRIRRTDGGGRKVYYVYFLSTSVFHGD